MIRLAQVVAVHPERRTLDLTYLDTGLRVAEVHSLSSTVADDAGDWDIPSVLKPTNESDAGSLSATSGRKVVAAVAMMGGRPVILGFLHPLGGQVAFMEDDRTVSRHSSGAYSTVAPDGSIELYHPSGSYLRIGTGPHQNLKSVSVDQKWMEHTDAPQPTISVVTQKYSLTVDPSGNTVMTTQGTMTLHSDGNMAVTTQGTLGVTSQGAMNVSAHGTLTLHSDSTVTITGTSVTINP